MENKKIKSLRQKLEPLFCKYGQIAGAYVFGSYVQGEMHPTSDIDLAVVLFPGKK